MQETRFINHLHLTSISPLAPKYMCQYTSNSQSAFYFFMSIHYVDYTETRPQEVTSRWGNKTANTAEIVYWSQVRGCANQRDVLRLQWDMINQSCIDSATRTALTINAVY